MGPELIDGIIAITAMGTIGTFILIGMRMRMRHRELQSSPERTDDIDRLADAVEHLSDQVSQLTAETSDLQERLDFTERLLTSRPEEHPVEANTPNH